MSPLAYRDRLRGQRHCLLDTQRQGQRVNALNFLTPHVRFDYGFVMGAFDTQRYLPLMH